MPHIIEIHYPLEVGKNRNKLTKSLSTTTARFVVLSTRAVYVLCSVLSATRYCRCDSRSRRREQNTPRVITLLARRREMSRVIDEKTNDK